MGRIIPFNPHEVAVERTIDAVDEALLRLEVAKSKVKVAREIRERLHGQPAQVIADAVAKAHSLIDGGASEATAIYRAMGCEPQGAA